MSKGGSGMNSLLISIRPEWVAKILNGEKTIEVRKTAPKCDLPIDVYVYCTKSKDFMLDQNADGTFFVWDKRSHHYIYAREGEPKEYYFEGKVVAKFTLKTIGSLCAESLRRMEDGSGDYILNDACLTLTELKEYAKGKEVKLWYISDLQIFDEPKELSEFYALKCNQKKRPCNIKDVFGVEECNRICKLCKPLTKAPQSWCYVEAKE